MSTEEEHAGAWAAYKAADAAYKEACWKRDDASRDLVAARRDAVQRLAVLNAELDALARERTDKRGAE